MLKGMVMKRFRFFSFIPAKKYPFIAAGAVELWVTRSVIQAPRGQRAALSIRRGKSSSRDRIQPKGAFGLYMTTRLKNGGPYRM